MERRRKTQVEQRRRRVLRDDIKTSATPKQAGDDNGSASRPKCKPYTDAALADGQPRITDFIPQRVWTLLVLLLGGLSLIAALETLHAYRFTWQRWSGQAELGCLDLTSPASLASWCSSMILGTAAVFACIVYSIRRHKADDYQGKYGLWLWAVCGCLVASIDTTANLHRVVQGALVALTGTPLVGDGSIWWIALGIGAYGVISLRVLLDMRGCPTGRLTLGVATACYGFALLCTTASLRFSDPLITVMLGAGALMLGHYLLLFSFLLFARHVFRDAQGQIHVGNAKPRQAQTKHSRRTGRHDNGARQARRQEVSKTVSPPSPNEPPCTSVVSQENIAIADDADPDAAEPDQEPAPQSAEASIRMHDPDPSEGHPSPPTDTAKRTKAERRRLRKQQRRHRQAA